MAISKQDQLRHENNTWNREIEFFKQENALLKTRLSVVIDSSNDKKFILLAEYFQNQFLLKDELISDLKSDINNQGNEIKLNINKNELPGEILNRQETLRKEISYFETDFSRLKNEFNQSLTQLL